MHSKKFLNINKIFYIFISSFSLISIYIKNFDIDESIRTLLFFSVITIIFEILYKFLTSFVISSELKGKNFDFGSYEGHLFSKKNKFKVLSIFALIFYSIISVVLTHLTVVLFGAYVVQDFEATLVFSFLVASLVFIRPLIKFGTSAVIAVCEDWNWSNSSQVQGSFVLFGVWLGTFVIPLDWDRPWQVWPIPCAVGGLLGELAASLALLLNSFGKEKKVI
ncbi:Phosphatidylinositol-glycan biosynthesis class F protein [Armadillidium nasatum]|uniref:Phosphatidylinositol-glycan biosynthesis class F protein n=1 Tax=Armadillidium nasatum TaxID=96803 RepID=A0A5N5TKV7_9CRUS|nr:Phosphatidylinositol-glycan biosynthesis class F protein [Armadillidium nasatum]